MASVKNGYMYHDYCLDVVSAHVVKEAITNVLMTETSVSVGSEEMNTVIEVRGDDNGTEYDLDEEEDLSIEDLCRAHWIQLQKTNKQGAVIQNTFVHVIEQYPHMRPMWQFSRKLDAKEEDWKAKLYEDFYFRHHCASIQAAMTMLMENKDDHSALRKLLNQIGAHHFFYDAVEMHFEVFKDAMLGAMDKVLGGHLALDDDTRQSWMIFLDQVKLEVGEGIMMQRTAYLQHAFTKEEMQEILSEWRDVEEMGTKQAAVVLCQAAFQMYKTLLVEHQLDLPLPTITNESSSFMAFSNIFISAFETTIKSFEDKDGFLELPSLLEDSVVRALMLDVCPSLMRKAFMHGVIVMLKKVQQSDEMAEREVQTWSKLYRVMEQAITANIVNY